MPCGAPSSFTRAMKAGGKLYSRPQISPIFMPGLLARSTSGDCRLGLDSRAGLAHDVLHDLAEIAGSLPDPELPRRPPFVLFDQRASVEPEPQVPHVQLVQLDDVRPQLARGAIDDLKFLFDADREIVI